MTEAEKQVETLMGQALLRHGRLNEALTALVNGDDTEGLLKAARAFFAGGRHDQAADIAVRVAHSEHVGRMANDYIDVGRVDLAQRVLEACGRPLKAAEISAHGEVYLKKELFHPAATAFRLADNREGLTRVAWALCWRDQFLSAARILAETGEPFPPEDLALNAQEKQDEGRPEEAAHLWVMAGENSRASALGYDCMNRGQFALAALIFECARDTKGLVAVGQKLLQLRDWQVALRVLILSNELDIVSAAGETLTRCGQRVLARHAFAAAGATAKLIDLGHQFLEFGELLEARDCFVAAKHRDGMFLLAERFVERGELHLARETFQILIRLL